MKKLVSTALVVLCCSGLFAQDFWQDRPHVNLTRKDTTLNTSFVAAEGLFAYGCDGLHNGFLNKLYFGGYLDSSYIENSASPLLPVNRFGVQTSMGIMYAHQTKDSTNTWWSLALLNRNNISGRFNDDAFRLAFQGNTRFKGQEADFSRTRFTYMSWTQLRFGYQTPQPHGSVSVSFSALVGHRYHQANIEYGKLYTDPQGIHLTGAVAGDYWSSDTANTAAFALNGFGTAVDINWTWMKPLANGGRHVVKVDLMDFGFINWNNKTIHQYVDTTVEWSGIDIAPYLLDPDYVTELPEQSDFLKTDTNSFHRSIFLPAVARATYTFWFSPRMLLEATAAMPFWSEALPFGSLTTGRRFEKIKTTLSGGIAYGGYAKVQVPLKAELYMLPHANVEIGSTNVLSLINPATMTGAGAYVKLSYSF